MSVATPKSQAKEPTQLDVVLAEFERDRNHGEPWREVLRRVQASRAR